MFSNVKQALKKAKAGEVEEDDGEDEDYEETAGEFALYDSPLESTDELVSIKETLDVIFQADQNAYQYITSSQTDEERNHFVELIGKADELKQREAACKAAFEQNEAAQKIQSVVP